MNQVWRKIKRELEAHFTPELKKHLQAQIAGYTSGGCFSNSPSLDMSMTKENLIKLTSLLWINSPGFVGVGLLLACASSSSLADDLASEVSWSVIGRNITITEPSFTAVGDGSFSENTATVTSGSSVTLAGNYLIQEGDTSYCPGCIIQLYTAWVAPAQAGSVGFFSGGIYPGFGTQAGSISQEFSTLIAPRVPGTYFIGLGSTLDYFYYNNVAGSFGNDVNGLFGFAPFQVTVTPITLSPSLNPANNYLYTTSDYYYSTGGDFTNDGTLLNDNANLTHILGTFSNNGIFTNQGNFSNAAILNNQGILDNQNNLANLASGSFNNGIGSTLTNSGVLTNSGTLINQGDFSNTGTLNNEGTFINQSLLNNSGTITNTGQLNLTTTGQISGSGNLFNTSQGLVEITGADPHVIAGNITNEGVFKSIDTSVTFTGDFINNARYESDPSTNQFNNLSIGSDGYLVGGTGDTFIITGDFNNTSTQNTLWNTANSDLVFTGPNSTQHTMGLAGIDTGSSTTGAINNFSWNSMTLSSGNYLTLVDGNSTSGAALYTSRLILPDGVNQLNSINSNYNIYFDPTLPDNQYLLGSIRQFGSGNGQLLPWSLSPFVDSTISDPELTPDQLGFSAALNEACSAPTGIMATRCLQLQGLSPSQQKEAIASLTPDQVPGQMAGPIKFSATRMDAPRSRLASLRTGGGSAPLSLNFNGIQMSANKLGFNALGGAAGDDDDLFRDSPLGVFIQSRFNFGNMQNNIWDRGFESEARTVTAGADYRINDQLVAGLAFNYTNALTKYVQSAGRMDSDTYMGAFYGSYFLPKDFYVDWTANYGGNNYLFNRRYGYQGFDGQSNANADGHQYSFSVSSGKDFNWQEWLVGPFVRMEYLNMYIGEYQEQSSDGFNITTGEQINHSFISNLGGQISRAVSLNWGVLTPSVRVEWEHQYLNDNRAIEMRLSQAAPGLGNFTMQTGNPDRDYINLGGALSATLPNGGSGFVRYETRLGQSYISDHIVEAGLRLSF